MSGGGNNERRSVAVHVEGDTNGIYGAHDCVAIVKAFASTEGVELLKAKSYKRVDEALLRHRILRDELKVVEGKPCTLSSLL
jgi:hypothetical protein